MLYSICRDRRSILALVAAAALCVPLPANADKKRADFSRLVAVGDSLTAGVQDIGLEKSRQETGFVPLIAKQAGVEIVLPLVTPPGAPPVLAIDANGIIGPSVFPIPMVGRVDPFAVPYNLGVPSYTVRNALVNRPGKPDSPGDRGPLVLGFPDPYLRPGCGPPPMSNECLGKTMIEQAKDRNPTTTLVWIGNNDALIPAIFGAVQNLTPEKQFEADFKQIMAELASTASTLIVATIPDVTTTAFFTSARDIADKYNVSMGTMQKQLDLNPNDYVRRSALPIIDGILNGGPGTLPTLCKPPIYVMELVTPMVPCRLTADEARDIAKAIREYNRIIEKETRERDGLLVDTNKLVDIISRKGYVIGDRKLTTKFLGGLFSLDGIHPSRTGYAIIANYFIEKMNREYRLKMEPVSVEQVWENDPLKPFAKTLPADRRGNNFDE